MRNALIELLNEKTGQDVTTTHGAAKLLENITGKISRQTVQRLTGALKDYKDNETHLRGSSKEIIAKYLGYDSWQKLETFLRKIAITGPENMYRKAATATGEERSWGAKRDRKLGKHLIQQAAEAGCKDAVEFIANNPKEFNKYL